MTEVELRLKLDHFGYNEEFSQTSSRLIYKLIDNIEYLHNENNSLSQENSCVKHESRELHEQMIELRIRYEEAERTIEDLKIFNSECLNKVENYENEVRELINRVDILEDNDTYKKGYMEVDGPIPQPSIDYNQHHHHYHQLQCGVNHDFLDDLDMALKRCEFLNQQMEIAQQNMQIKTNKLNFYKDQLDRAEAETIFSKKRYEDIIVENEKLRMKARDLESLTIENSSLQNDVSLLRNRNGELENELNALKSAHITELHDYEKEVENIHNEQVQLSKAITRMRSLESQLKVLEEERDFYRKKYDLLKFSSPGGRRVCDTPPVRDKEFDVGDISEIKILRDERESLRDQLNILQRKLIDVNGNVKILSRERDMIQQNYKKLQKELYNNQEVFMIKDTTNSSAAAARQTMLRRLQKELDQALSDVQRLATERDSLRFQLEAQSQHVINEKSHLYRKADDAQLYAQRARIERDRDKKEMEKIYSTAQTLFNDRKVFKDRATELENSMKEMDRLRKDVINNLERELDETLHENQKLRHRVNELYEATSIEEEARLNLEAERSTLFYEQSELEHEIKQLHLQRNEQITRGNKLSDRVAELERNNIRLKSDLSNMEHQIGDLECCLQRKTEEHNESMNYNTKLKDDIEKLKDDIDNLHNQTHSLEVQLAESNEANDSLAKDMDFLNTELDNQLNVVKSLDTKLTDRDHSLFHLDEDLHKTLHELQDKVEIISSLHNKLTDRENNVKELYCEIDNLQMNLHDRKTQVMDYQNQIQHLVHEVDALNHHVEARSQKIKELAHRYEKRENKLLDRLAHSESLICEFQNHFSQICPELESQLKLLGEYQAKIHETEHRAQHLSDHLSEITPLFYERSSQLSQAQQGFEETKELVSSLERRMIEADQRLMSINQKNELLAHENCSSIDEINRLSALLDGHTRHSSLLEENSRNLETRLYEAENLRDKAEQNLRHIEMDCKRLIQENYELQASVKIGNDQNSDLRKDLSSKCEKLEKLMKSYQEHESMKARLEKNQMALDQLTTRYSEIVYQLQCKTEDLSKQHQIAEKYHHKSKELSNILQRREEKMDYLSRKLEKYAAYEEKMHHIDKMHHQNCELHERLIEAEKLACDLDSRLQEQKTETEIRNQDLVSALNRLQSDEDTIDDLEKQMKSIEKESAHLKDYMSKMSKEMDSKESELDAVKALLQNKNDLLNQLTQELDRCHSVTVKYEELKLEHHKTLQCYERLEAKMKNLKNKLEDREAAIEDLGAHLSGKIADNSLMSNRLENADNQIESMEQKLSECAEIIERKDFLLNENFERISELSSQLLQKEMESSQLHDETVTLTESLHEAGSALTEIRDKMSCLLDEYTQQNRELQDVKPKLEIAYDKLSHLQNRLEDRDEKINRLENELLYMGSNIAERNNEIQKLQSHLEDVEENIVLMRNELDESERMAAKLKVLKNQQSEQIASLKETMETLDHQLRKCNTQLAYSDQTINDSLAQRTELEYKVNELLNLLGEKNDLLEQSVNELNLAQSSLIKMDEYKRLCAKQDAKLIESSEMNFRLDNELRVISGRLNASETRVESLGFQLGDVMEKLNERTVSVEEKCHELGLLSEEISHLKYEQKSHIDSIDFLAKENEHMKNHWRDCKTLELDFHLEVQDLEYRRSTAESLANDYAERLKLQEKDFQELQSQLEQLKKFEYLFSKSDSTITRLEQERDSLSDKYRKSTSELLEKEAINHNLVLEMDHLTKNYNNLREEMNNLKDAAENVANNYEEAINVHNDLMHSVETLKREREFYKTKSDSLFDQLSIERETVSIQHVKLEEYAERARKAEANLENLSNDLECCRDQLHQNEIRSQHMIEDLLKADNVLKHFSSEKTRLESEIVQLSTDNSNLEAWMESYRNRLGCIEQDIASRNDGINSLRQSLGETELQLNQISQVSRGKEAELTHLKIHIEQLKSENFRLIHENSNLPNLLAQTATLEGQVRATQNEMHCLRAKLDSLTKKNFEYATQNAHLANTLEYLKHQRTIDTFRSQESVMYPTPPVVHPDYNSVIYSTQRISTPVLPTPIHHHHCGQQHHPHHPSPPPPPPGSFLCRHQCLHSANCGLHDLLNHSATGSPSKEQCVHRCKRKGKKSIKNVSLNKTDKADSIDFVWNTDINTNCNNQEHHFLNQTHSISCPNSPINSSCSASDEDDDRNRNSSSNDNEAYCDVTNHNLFAENRTYDRNSDTDIRTIQVKDEKEKNSSPHSHEAVCHDNRSSLFNLQQSSLSDSESESELKDLSGSQSNKAETYTELVYSTPVKQNQTVSLPFMTNALANISSIAPGQSPLATYPASPNSKLTVNLEDEKYKSNDDDTAKDCSSVFSSQAD